MAKNGELDQVDDPVGRIGQRYEDLRGDLEVALESLSAIGP
jgi:hypothetical protein